MKTESTILRSKVRFNVFRYNLEIRYLRHLRVGTILVIKTFLKQLAATLTEYLL